LVQEPVEFTLKVTPDATAQIIDRSQSVGALMSVRPINFLPNGDIEVVNDELGHSGTILAADIDWSKEPVNNTESHNFIILNCPDQCGSVSTWPVGGSDPSTAQPMFVKKTTRDGCACGDIVSGDSEALCESHVRLNVNRMGGPGHWQLDSTTTLDTEFKTGSGETMFQVVYLDPGNGLIVGMNPAGGAVGSAHKVAVLHDMDEYEILCKTDPAYLSDDKLHILSAPDH